MNFVISNWIQTNFKLKLCKHYRPTTRKLHKCFMDLLCHVIETQIKHSTPEVSNQSQKRLLGILLLLTWFHLTWPVWTQVLLYITVPGWAQVENYCKQQNMLPTCCHENKSLPKWKLLPTPHNKFYSRSFRDTAELKRLGIFLRCRLSIKC